MDKFIDPTVLTLNDCGCCQGITSQTPFEIDNRPGLQAIAYRVGTHTQFKQSLLASLSDRDLPALKNLTTRETDDFTIALLDAWATIADVLTFYQERLANESYLRTATERLSVLQLARVIGYELRPGVAASTYLAFTVEDTNRRLINAMKEVAANNNLAFTAADTAGKPQTAIIDVGTKVQSIPGPGEQPQTFETVEKIEARAEWNIIKPRLSEPQILSVYANTLWLKGLTTQLKPGDALLLINGGEKKFRRVKQVTLDNRVTLDNVVQQTIVELEEEASTSSKEEHNNQQPRSTCDPNTSFQQEDLNAVWLQSNLISCAQSHGWSISDLRAKVGVQRTNSLQPQGEVHVFRAVANLFGYNAPNTSQTTKLAADETEKTLYLDNPYDAITAGSYVAIFKTGDVNPQICKVNAVKRGSRNAYGITGKTTILTLDSFWWDSNSQNPSNNFTNLIQGTVVYVQSEQLSLSEKQNTKPVSPNSSIVLDNFYPDLLPGQRVVFTGKLTTTNENNSEVLVLAQDVIKTAGGYTQISFLDGLKNSYHRDSVTINANVAMANQGETVEEVLGSGQNRQPYQHFTLRQPPLTFVSGITPSGAASTLQVRVNDVLWHEVSNLYQKEPTERIYTIRQNDQGQTTLIFGDGNTGARLPTGVDNIRATYRKGIGQGGNVQAEQLSLLMTHPLGVKSVINPLPASGGDDPETLKDARQNAPLTVLTLDRIVSLQDYEDFARSFAGFAKALATWTWTGHTRGVFVTVAGPKGAAIDSTTKVYENLVAAMQQAGDPYVSLQVHSYQPAFFRLKAGVQIDPDYVTDQVLTDIRQTLENHFGFEARSLGQGVALSEVIQVMQSVTGVIAIDVDQLYRLHKKARTRQQLGPDPYLLAQAPKPGDKGTIAAAELLMLDPNYPPQLLVMNQPINRRA